jgi:hypothetical protein
LDKTCTSEFFDDYQNSMHESEGRVLVEVFEKLTSAWFIQTARENMHYVGKIVQNFTIQMRLERSELT